MRVHATDRIRNVALVGHGQSGKTSLAEAMLYAARVTDRLGSVDAGNTVSDADPEEVARKISISLALLPLEWGEYKVNLLDCPGYADFAGEVACALRAADAALVVVDASSGVGVQTERHAAAAKDRGLARMIVITKLDKEHTDFARTLAEVEKELGCRAVAVTVPIGEQAGLRGVVDLVKGTAWLASDGKETEGPVPEDMAGVVEEYRRRLIEAAAESDDRLMEKYFEEDTLAPEEIARGLRAATISGAVTPAAVAVGPRMLGIHALLDSVVANLPAPHEMPPASGVDPRTGQTVSRKCDPQEPLSAVVFKTTTDPYAGRLSYFRVYSGTLHSDSQVYNATRGERERVGSLLVPVGRKHEGVPQVTAGDMGLVAKLHNTLTGDTLCDEGNQVQLPGIELPRAVFAVAIRAKSRADEDKVGSALGRLAEEDPTIRFSLNPETKETVLEGLGDLQLEVVVSRLQRKFGVEVETGAPKVAYRETIKAPIRVQGKHKKQTGGRGQYGDVWVQVEPLPRGAGFEFVDAVKGGAVPRNFIPAVEKGLREACEHGVLAGYPVVDIRCTLDDGSSHPVDSSDLAFKIAGSLALQKALEEAGSILLEPIAEVEVVVPAEQMGDVIGMLNAKRGSILGMEPKGSMQVVRALVPIAEMAQYASELRSLTGGRGTYTMQFSHYQEVPPHLAQGIIEAARREREQAKS